MKEHIAAAATMASAAYPNWNPTRDTFEVWVTLMPDLTGEQLVRAMTAHIRSSKFPPTVADILDRSKALTPDSEPSAILAWGEVHRAIRDGERAVWSYPQTAPALDVLGGWVRVAGCQSSEVASLRSRFCEAFDQLHGTQLREVEAAKIAGILGNGSFKLLENLNPEKALE